MPAQLKLEYYQSMCSAFGLDPIKKPFGLIKFRDGKEQLYALKSCSEQLADHRHISIQKISEEKDEDTYTVWVRASYKDAASEGDTRNCDNVGVVPYSGSAVDKANAKMKAFTKASRRAVLSLCGAGMLDESELDTVQGAQVINIEQKKQGTISEKKIEENEEEKYIAKKREEYLEAVKNSDTKELVEIIEDIKNSNISGEKKKTLIDAISSKITKLSEKKEQENFDIPVGSFGDFFNWANEQIQSGGTLGGNKISECLQGNLFNGCRLHFTNEQKMKIIELTTLTNPEISKQLERY
jgi:hypothetical protein